MAGIGAHQSPRSETVTWLTPPGIVSALGPFDLDPCAAPLPRPWPTAARHVCLPEDGLKTSWGADFVWCNPPYDRQVADWLEAMGRHGHGIALVFARTETEWFWSHVWRSDTATAILFLEGRLHFHYPDGRRAAANSGAPSVLVAYGDEAARRLSNRDLAGAFVPLRSYVNPLS